jgi:hypothetical protein
MTIAASEKTYKRFGPLTTSARAQGYLIAGDGTENGLSRLQTKNRV